MLPNEQKMLDDLFEGTRAAENAPRDPEAEALINESLRAQPHAPYLLAQAVLVQDQALKAAAGRARQLEQKIADLEKQGGQPARSSSSSFLGGLFGGQTSQPAEPGYAQRPAPSQAPWATEQAPVPGPWGAAPAAPSPGGSFLRGAMGTAAGVAGGMLLANSLSGLFGGNHGLFGGANGLSNPQEIIEENVFNNNYFGSGTGTSDASVNAGQDGADDGGFLSNASLTDVNSGDWDDSFSMR